LIEIISPGAGSTILWAISVEVPMDRINFFAMKAGGPLGVRVADALNTAVMVHEERDFEDGEHKSRPIEAVGGRDIYVLQDLHGTDKESVNDRLCKLLFFIGSLKDAGAARVTAVVPYLCYARKDRRTKPSDPVTTRYVAGLFESVGTDTVITLDVHNPAAFENAFRRRTIALTAAPLFVEYAASLPAEKLCVVSPDTGGAKRAEIFREALEAAKGIPISKGFVEKHRSAGVLSGGIFAGDASGATALIIDDLVSSGHTMVRAAKAARQAGAHKVLAVATHPLFGREATELLSDPVIDQIVVTDSIPVALTATLAAKIVILPTAPLIGEAIKRTVRGESLSDLLVY
jgi:ribose-phosphate pyrophosphokinase